jgi:ketosteroid isomerase-like protein
VKSTTEKRHPFRLSRKIRSVECTTQAFGIIGYPEAIIEIKGDAMRLWKQVCAAAGLLLAGVAAAPAQNAGATDHQAITQIRQLIATYMQAVDAADPAIAAKVFLTTPDVSFINPLGHERGWDQIADEVFVRLMGQTFSKRSLKASAEPVIHVYGDAAVAEFDWDFHATLRSNGSPVHTTGRESQFYVKFPDKGWRLVHVHYSGPAIPPPSNGNF